MSKAEWTPSQGEVVWIKVFSNWSKGTYIGYDVIKNQHLVRETEEGGGHLFASANVLPEHANPNEPKIDKKQNSVEWLAQAIYDKMKMKGDGKVFQGILDEALAMHKEEMLQTFEVEDDVEKLGNEFSNGFALHLSSQLVVALNEGFKAGYLKAREKYKYTEEDLKNVIECTLELTKTSNGL